MKKSLFICMFAVIAMVFASCKPGNNNQGDEYTKLFFTEETVTVGIGSTYQLYLDWEPTAAADPTSKCEWASSNESVATVNKGMVSGIANGTCNITATLGDHKAVVEVVVIDSLQAERQAIEFTTMVMFGWNPQYKEQHILERDVKVDLSIGTVNCYVEEKPVYLTGSGIVLGEEEIEGADYEVYGLLPLYVIDEPKGSANAKYNGYYVSFQNGYSVGAQESVGVMEAGHFDDFAKYAEFVDKYMLQEDVTWAQANAQEYYFNNLKGAILQYHDYDSENSGEVEDGTSWTLGFMTEGDFNVNDDDNLIYVNLKLRWFDEFFGLEINADETDIVRPYNYVYSDLVYSNAETVELSAPAIHNPRFVPVKVASNNSIKSQLSKEFFALPIKANVQFTK